MRDPVVPAYAENPEALEPKHCRFCLKGLPVSTASLPHNCTSCAWSESKKDPQPHESTASGFTVGDDDFAVGAGDEEAEAPAEAGDVSVDAMLPPPTEVSELQETS